MNTRAPWLERWPVTYPCSRGPWTVTDGAEWGIVDPNVGVVSAVNPRDDPKLIGLPKALDYGRLVSYRHHRRAVVETSAGYTKVTTPKRVAPIAARYLLAAEVGLRGPRLISAHHDGRIELTRIPGESLNKMLIGNRRGDRHLVATADAMSDLHRHRPPGLNGHVPSTDWIETTDRGDPELATELRRIHRSLPPVPVDDLAMIHTDLHDKNVVLSGRATLIDLDGLALGHPAVDLGNLLAHMELRALQHCGSARLVRHQRQSLLRRYDPFDKIDRGDVAITEAHTYLRLAALYRFRLPSRHLVSTLLRLAEVTATVGGFNHQPVYSSS